FPEVKTSDAIVGMDMNTGKISWVRQAIKPDVSVSGCRDENPDPAVCSDDAPDVDFGSSPSLVENNGKRLLVAANKAAIVYGFDPDHEGKLLWQQRVGKGSSLGGIVWGGATDGQNFYAPLSDPERIDAKVVPNSGGGLVA